MVCLDARAKLNYGTAAIGLCGHIGAPMGHGGFLRAGDPDIAVDAAAGIPAGAFRLVVQFDFYEIVPLFEPGVQFHGPGGVAVRPASGFGPVNIYLGVGESAVHLQSPVLVQVLYGQGFAISSLSPPGQFAGFAGVLLHEGLFHAPVVRQVQDAGGAIFGKGPSFVPQLPAAGLGGCAQGQENTQ